MNYRQVSIPAYDDINLYAQIWNPGSEVRAVLVVVHGGFEHSGRYAHVAAFFTGRQFAVYACDLRGHGRSEGVRAHIEKFDDFLHDMDVFLAYVRNDFPDKDVFILAHSAGALITLAYLLARGRAGVKGVVFSAPALKVYNIDSAVTRVAVHLVALISPDVKFPLLDARFLSHDAGVVEAYRRDVLVHKEGVTARVVSELLQAMRRVRRKFRQVDFPLLILHGTRDRFADIRASRHLYRAARSADKSIRYYGGLFHELLQEPEKEQILGEIYEWINKRICGKMKTV